MAIGAYSKIVSTPRKIDSIHTFIGGTREDITSAWTFVNGVRKQVFPSDEFYTEVYSQATGGAYSTTIGYGRYKIVYSGGGGSGSSVTIRKTGSVSNRSQSNGSAGQEITVYLDVEYGQTKTITGTVGTGAAGSYTYASTSSHSQTAGTPGTGYASGGTGTTKSFVVSNKFPNPGPDDTGYGAMAGGSGGGSTSFFIDGVIQEIAKGGNGGGASLVNMLDGTKSVSGGTGGSGGTNSGTGATGGAATYVAGSNSGNTSGAGSDGYVKIYKSNIYPN